MVQTLEYPWNGIAVTGPLPTGGLGAFVDAPTRGIERVRVLLDPRVVMPLGGTDPLPPLTTGTAWGAPLGQVQSDHARTIVQTCYDATFLGDLTRRRRAAVLSLACASVESSIKRYANPNVPNSQLVSPPADATSDGSNLLSVGIYQQQVGPGFQKSNSLADVTEVMDTVGGTLLWLGRLDDVPNWWVDSGDAIAGDIIRDAQRVLEPTTNDEAYEAEMPDAGGWVTEIGWPPTAPPAVGGGVIPASVQTAILEIANGAIAASPYTVNVQIEWCLDATQWPTSATAGRRPRVADLTTFWEAMRVLVGSHAATWGFSLLNNPTFAATAAANQDPHASMTSYANVTWSAGTDPTTADHQTACRWLETLTSQVRLALRTAGFTKNIAVPTMYAPGHLRNIALFHPNGPWINDGNVWYETSFFPAGLDETQIRATYASYNTWANGLGLSYRSSWVDDAYYTGGTGVVAPETLPSPPQEALPSDPNAAPISPPSAPTIDQVIVGPASLRVLWTPPTNTGGAEITGYVVRLNNGSEAPASYFAGPDDVGLTVGGLSDGVEYAVSVAALNQAGSSPLSTEVLATPLADAPPLDVPPPPPPVEDPDPIQVEAPSIIAFYPEGVADSAGYFNPSNWAGL